MDLKTRVLMEGNLSNEVGLVVLDLVELFCNHFKVRIESLVWMDLFSMEIICSHFRLRVIPLRIRFFVSISHDVSPQMDPLRHVGMQLNL